MDPTEALATTDRETPAQTSAPAAANWLAQPTEKKDGPTQAKLWADEPEWNAQDEEVSQ
jgi:hypothetical protein